MQGISFQCHLHQNSPEICMHIISMPPSSRTMPTHVRSGCSNATSWSLSMRCVRSSPLPWSSSPTCTWPSNTSVGDARANGTTSTTAWVSPAPSCFCILRVDRCFVFGKDFFFHFCCFDMFARVCVCVCVCVCVHTGVHMWMCAC